MIQKWIRSPQTLRTFEICRSDEDELHCRDVMYEIKTGKSNVASLKANESSNIDAQIASIEELGDAISMDEADVKAATVGSDLISI